MSACIVILILCNLPGIFIIVEAGTMMILNVFLEGDLTLYGFYLDIKNGRDFLCNLPAATSPSNYTCNDNKSMVFLQSNKSLFLITEATNRTFHLECNGTTYHLEQNIKETFNSSEDALRYIRFWEKQTPTSGTSKDLYWFLLLLPIGGAIFAAWKWRCWRKRPQGPQIDANEQHEPLNNVDTNTDQPISNSHTGLNLIQSNGGSPNGVISCDFMNSNFQTTSV